MLNSLGGWLSGHNVENTDNLWRHRVNNRDHVGAQRNVAFVQEFDSQALILGGGDRFPIVIIDVEVLGGIDQSEIFCALHNCVNAVSDIENEGRSPVLLHSVVDVGLGGGANHEETVSHRHVHYALSEVKIFVELMKDVGDVDLVIFVKDCLH